MSEHGGKLTSEHGIAVDSTREEALSNATTKANIFDESRYIF
jgi:hypothetical protein